MNRSEFDLESDVESFVNTVPGFVSEHTGHTEVVRTVLISVNSVKLTHFFG